MLFIPKGCKGTEAIHYSSSKHSSHKHDPNLSVVVKDVPVSLYSPYLLNPARQFPRPVLQLKMGCQALGNGHSGCSWTHSVTPKPSVDKDLQRSPGQRSCTSTQATHAAARKLLHVEGDNVGSSHLATLSLPSVANTLHHSACQQQQPPKTPFHHCQKYATFSF